MATTVDTLLVRIESDMSKLKGDLNKIANQSEQTADKMSASFKKAGAALAAVGGVAALGGLIKGFISAGAEVENLRVRFNTLYGSAAQGEKAFKAISKYASEVPFSLQDIQKGAAPLAIVAKDASQLGAVMKLTGTIAAASGMGFADASVQVQRALTAGISSAEMFKDNGVAAMAGFQRGVTYTTQQTVDMLVAAYGPGGKYDGVTDNLAKTTDGALSMLGDAWFSFQTTVAQSGLNDAFIGLINSVKDLLVNIKPLAVIIGATLGGAFKAVGAAVRFVTNNLMSLVTGLGIYFAISTAVAVFAYAREFILLAKGIKAAAVAMRVLNFMTTKSPLMLAAMAATFLAERMGVLGDVVDGFTRAFEHMLPQSVLDQMALLGDTVGDVDSALADAENHDPYANLGDGGSSDPKAVAKALSELNTVISQNSPAVDQLRADYDLLSLAIGNMSGPAKEKAIAALTELEAKIKAQNPLYAESISAIQSMSSSISNTMVDALSGAKNTTEALTDIFRSFVRTMIAKAIELMVVNQIMNKVFGLTGSNALPTASIGGLGKAGGGTIQGGKATLVGERGPELFVPNTGGTILNNMNSGNALGGGKSTTIVQNFNVSTGVAQTVKAEIMSMLPAIKADTMASIVDAKRRGGAFSSAFG